MLSALTTMILAAWAAPDLQDPAEAGWIAMTRSGVRIEVAEKPASGAREFHTPYGLYFTPLDPVAVVLKAPQQARWRHDLEARPDMDLMAVVEELNADGRLAELIELTAHLEQLQADAEGEHQVQRARELVAAGQALQDWGGRLNPVSNKLSTDERVEWLWKQASKIKGPEALLYTGRLMEEVIPGQSGIGVRQITGVDLHRALGSRNPFFARAGAVVAGRQLSMDAMLGAVILDQSILHDNPLVRDGCADGISQLWPNHARQYWADILFRWKDELRIRAAWNLVDHLPDQAEAPLVLAMAAKDSRAGRKISIGGMTLLVEDRQREPRNPLAGLPMAQPGGS